MYQGKFDSKNKQGANVYDLLEQRKTAPKGRPAQKPGPAPQQRQVPQNRPDPRRPRQEAAPVAPAKKSKVNKGTLVFYGSCLAFAAVFYAIVFVGMIFLRGWLVRFEAAQPTVKCQEVFEELFENPNWERLYTTAQLDDAGFGDAASFGQYMTQRIDGRELSYMETSAGLSGDKKYIVRAGDERIAVFTLEDLNDAQGMADVPDWQLKVLEFYLTQSESCRVVVEEGSTVLVNGKPLGEEALIMIRNSRANDYLPTFAQAPRHHVLQVDGLMTEPKIEVTGRDGQSLQVVYDAETATYTALPDAGAIPEEREALALKALETYALFMNREASAGQLSTYFDRNSDAYQNTVSADLAWVQKGSDYTFTDESVTDYRVHNADIFSVRVSVNLNITRSEDGSVKENVITQSMFFTKNSSGNWVCFDMTAVDVNQWSDEVRLVFRSGEEILQEGFVSAEGEGLTFPQVEIPEGKTFAGWAAEETDENGGKVLRLVFAADEAGNIALPYTLTPMTLVPVFE